MVMLFSLLVLDYFRFHSSSLFPLQMPIFFFFYASAIFNGEAYSIIAVRTSVRPECNTNGFHVISFEKIGVLD